MGNLHSEKYSELKKKNTEAELGGGISKIEAQHKKGKQTARERIDQLLDANSFQEIDKFVKHRTSEFGLEDQKFLGDGVVTGYGTIGGRPINIFSQDFTVFGGSLGEMYAQKIIKIMDLSMKNGCPIIGLNDSGGARIQEGVASLAGYGDIFHANVQASGVVPQISVIMGPTAGGAVYSPAVTDFIIMVDKTSYMFITGPGVVKSVTGEDISFDDLGGAKTHTQKSGVAHFRATSEEQALAIVNRLLEYIPQNNMEVPPKKEIQEQTVTTEFMRNLLPASSNEGYDVREVICSIIDKNSFLEVHKDFAENIVVGFGFLEGHSVGIVGNQPAHMAGVVDIDASDKASRFIRFCDAFNIPIITFVDVPGFMPGSDQEHRGIIRHGAKLLYAFSEATVPKLTVILRKDYGGAYDVMASRHLGADHVFAWPTSEIAVMGAESAVDIIYRKELATVKDPEKIRSTFIKDYQEKFSNPYIAAELGLIDSVIFPEETRNSLIKALKQCENKRLVRVPRKHGNMPL
ncbi:MAG: putative propionyl-CoA carboxylase beta chain 5 [Candidatus Heimdallarchaeota archaeon LC_2]|nr:MAG: putative propionyl-CoA carboxylase beta chain 5 [Candidatus Heimdallarchaeota archaeon LC_2]